MWAVERILKKALPDLAGLQLSGDKDAPITTQHLTDSPIGADRELARRVGLLLGKAAEAPQAAQDGPTGARPTNGHSTAVMPSDGPGESSNGVCTPAVGATVDFDKARSITITRLTDDGRDDHGGDWDVQQEGKAVRKLRGITFGGAKDVVAAMDDGGKFDG